jgi:hypothetical protein
MPCCCWLLWQMKRSDLSIAEEPMGVGNFTKIFMVWICGMASKRSTVSSAAAPPAMTGVTTAANIVIDRRMLADNTYASVRSHTPTHPPAI